METLTPTPSPVAKTNSTEAAPKVIRIKRLQTFGILERAQVLLLTRRNESHRLSKSLHDQPGPVALFS